MTPRRAVFLDRDDTLVKDPGFLRRADDVALMPGAAQAVRRLNEAGIPVVVITNQSGIARGRITEQEYRAVTGRMVQLLEREGARLDGIHHCPHHPSVHGECGCRKPGTLLYQRAAEELELDLASSWYVGDRVTDVLPAAHFGGTGVLLHAARESRDHSAPPGVRLAPDLQSAVQIILGKSG